MVDSFEVSAGAKATDLNIANNGVMCCSINSNTYITGTSHGKAVKVGDGVIRNITVYGGYRADVANGWISYDVLVSGASYNCSQVVLNGGRASSTEVRGGLLEIRSGGSAVGAKVNGDAAYMNVSAYGVGSNTNVTNGGRLTVFKNGVHSGSLIFANGGSAVVSSGGRIDFSLSGRSASSDYLINYLSLVGGAPTYTITVSGNQASGTYKLAQGASNFSGSITIGNGSLNYGSVSVNGAALSYNGATYKLIKNGGNLTLTVGGTGGGAGGGTGGGTGGGAGGGCGECTDDVNSNLLSNGVSQIVAWDSDQGKVGYLATNGNSRPAWKGIWEWSSAEADLWRVAGVGHFKGTGVDYDGVLLYNGVGDRFAAWTNLRTGSYGYVNLCKVDGSFNTQCLANLDGDEYDDIIIYDDNGSIGVVLDGTTYKDIWHVEPWEQAKWTVVGAGSFDDGVDKLVMVNNENNFVYLWSNNDTSFSSWNWSTKSVAKLGVGWEVAAVGDFSGDGIDDIMVLDRVTNNVWVWDDGNSNNKRWRGTLGTGFEIEAVGDYNGDGCEDLLLREYNTGWGGMGYWGGGYAGNWTDLGARIETDMKSNFAVIA